ncbi:MAG: ABC transporter permease, partial [Clostridia bacterium]
MNDIFNVLLLQNTLRAATPVVLAALGCLLTQHVNITNIGIDGMILMGAFFAVLGSYLCGSWVMGIVFAAALGVLLGLFYYVFVIKFGSDEFIIGVALNIFAGGLTVFLLRNIFKVAGSFSDPGIVPLPTIRLPLIEGIPVLGPLLSGNTLFVYVSWLLVPL